MFFVLSCSTACAGVTEDLYNAVKNKNITPARIKALVKFGADVNYKDPEGVSILMNAVTNCSSSEVIKALTDSGAIVDIKNYDAALERAFNEFDVPAMRSLLKFGWDDGLINDVNKTYTQGSFPFFVFASGFLDYDSVKRILDAGADLKNGGGETINSGLFALLFAACFQDDPEVIKLLVKYGVDVNAKLYRGMTALMGVVSEMSIRSERGIPVKLANIKALINAGADVFAKDDSGKTAYDYAETDEIRNILLDAVK